MPYPLITQYHPGYPAADMNGVGSASSAGAKGDAVDYYCPLYNDVYSGHPDFEQMVYADGCSGVNGSLYRVNNLTSYGNGVRFASPRA